MFRDLFQANGLSLDRLHTFCVIAQAGSITSAAKGDPVRQSLYSRQLKELEQYFGIELVRRKGRGIEFTTFGHRLHAITRENLHMLSDFRKDCKGEPVELTIGAGDSLIQWLLLPRLDQVLSKLPNVRLNFLNLTTVEIASRLTEGTIDLGLLRDDAVEKPLKSAPLGVMGYSLFLPQALRNQKKGRGTGAALLNGLPLAILEGEGNFRRALGTFAKSHSIRIQAEVECSSFPLVARALVTGKLAAILPGMARAELEAIGAVEFPLNLMKRLDRKIGLAWNPRVCRIRPVLERATMCLAQILRF